MENEKLIQGWSYIDDDKPHEECAVFGIFLSDTEYISGAENDNDAAKYTVFGLHALQHRGQEAHGIVSTNGHKFFSSRSAGLVGDRMDAKNQEALFALKGRIAIGHNRYSTFGGAEMRNIQPLYADLETGGLAICHNGNLTNAKKIRRDLVQRGSIFQSTSDTETFIHLIALAHGGIDERIIASLHQVEGAYALLCLTDDALIGVRDPIGIRPLVLGKLGASYILASESVAFDIIGAEFIREIQPGEMVKITKSGIESRIILRNALKKARPCVFEHIYFARPDSLYHHDSIYNIRKKIGAMLANEQAIPADVVVPVPDSGVPAAIGYSEYSNIPFDLGIIRNHYVGRTFIEPNSKIRHLGVRLKHNANKGVIYNKRVILVDDSLVRGTTSKKIIEMVREAGAKEVHMRIASPEVKFPCFYGIDMPNKDDLLAASMSTQEICSYIGADSLGFISIDGLYKALGEENGRDNENPQFTDHYFTGDYPTPLQDENTADNAQMSLLQHEN